MLRYAMSEDRNISLTHLRIRRASRDDVVDIVRMLADDPLGSKRERYEQPLPAVYYRAFDRINADSNQELVVAELDGAVIGTLQLSTLPYLTYRGGTRALIEAVRVDARYRGQGIGQQLLVWAIERARALDCHLVQLTSDKQRPEALHFYRELGFVASHEGMKLHLVTDVDGSTV